MSTSPFGLVLLGLTLAIALPARAGTHEEELEALARAQAPGTTRVGDYYRGEAENRGGRTDWKVELEPTSCYWFSAAADSGTKVSLFLFAPDEGFLGGRAETKRSDTNLAMMSHCPKQSGMYRLQLKLTDGAGEYAVGVFAKAAPKKVAPPPKTDELSPLVEREAAALAPGAKRVGEMFSGDAVKSDWYTTFDAGTCYWVVAVGESTIDELYLYLWDPNEKRITQAFGKSYKASLGHCAKTSGMHHIQLKLNDGSGAYRVGIYAKAR